MLLTVEQAAQQLGTSSASSGACAPKSASPSSRSAATYASTARTSSPTSTPTARKQLTTSSRSTSGRLFGAQSPQGRFEPGTATRVRLRLLRRVLRDEQRFDAG